jgi:hypothetical protein
MKKNQKQFQIILKVSKMKNGFSIAEVLIALFVLSFGIMSAIFLMAGSMKDTMEARDLVVASMLSQEGTELVRNIRDNNVTEVDKDSGVREDPFIGFSDSDCIVDYDYHVDTDGSSSDAGEYYFSDNVLDCSVSEEDFNLYFRAETIGGTDVKFYSHFGSGDALTKFKRKIILTELSDDGQENASMIKVSSMVVWDGVDFPSSVEECHFGQKCIYSETILTNWIHFDN